MATARDVMTRDVAYVRADETLGAAATRMRDLRIGSLPICSDGRHLAGTLSDRDIVVKCIADGGNPYTELAGDFAEGEAVAIGPDESLETALLTMATHHVHRLPVIEGADLVGILMQADVTDSLLSSCQGEAASSR